MERMMTFQDDPLGVFLDRVELHIEAINRAIANIPRDRVRLHACWGNYDGPHVDDVELADVLPLLYRANVGALEPAVRQPAPPARLEGVREATRCRTTCC